jgi:hypothetical protein
MMGWLGGPARLLQLLAPLALLWPAEWALASAAGQWHSHSAAPAASVLAALQATEAAAPPPLSTHLLLQMLLPPLVGTQRRPRQRLLPRGRSRPAATGTPAAASCRSSCWPGVPSCHAG